MKTLNNILLLVLMLYLVACSEESSIFNITNDGISPVAINSSDITVMPTSGGAVIKYKLPDESDLLAVEAQYVLTTGQMVKVRSSFLADSIVVEGFTNTAEYDISLFVVDRAENYSPATVISVAPSESPISTILGTVDVVSDFGGMRITWENKEMNPVAIFVSSIEGSDTTELDVYYSDAKKGEFQVIGLDTVNITGFVEIRDKWQNYSEAHEFNLSPLYETELESDRIKAMEDVHFHQFGNANSITNFFTNESSGNIYPTGTVLTQSTPWYGSVDLTTNVKLSRIVFWQYTWGNGTHFYAGLNTHIWEVYGTNNPNPLGDADGEMDESWVFLMECELIKPSGLLPYINDNTNEEDKDQAYNRGHTFRFPLEAEKYRYIRIRAKQNYLDNTEVSYASRIDIFGDDRP